MREERGAGHDTRTGDRDELTDRDARIRELEATVSSLSVELVDAKERLSTLESKLRDGDDDTATTPVEEWVPAAGTAENGSADGSSSARDEESSGRKTDDIIVA